MEEQPSRAGDRMGNQAITQRAKVGAQADCNPAYCRPPLASESRTLRRVPSSTVTHLRS
jgi:hypothetical protein